MLDTIEVVKEEDCSGCEACVTICPTHAIRMESRDGFAYPRIDKKDCILCGRCNRVCNCMNARRRQYTETTDRAFLYKSRDEKVLFESTSGGFFTKLAADIVGEGGIVFSPAFDDKWEVGFACIEKGTEIQRIRGSKYVEAKIGDTYYQVGLRLEQGKKVLFSGSPCQVSGLMSYLAIQQIKKQENLVLSAIICHGSVSPEYFKKFIDFISREHRLTSINFREKTYGYSTSTFASYYEDGSSYHESYDSGIYLPAYFSGLSIRKNCFNCKFRGGQSDADFMIGDYWKPTGKNMGQTVILPYSRYAKTYMEGLKQSHSDCVEEIMIEDAIAWNGHGDKCNSCLLYSPKENQQRENFIRDAFNIGIDELRKKYFPITIKGRIKKLLRPVRYHVKKRFRWK